LLVRGVTQTGIATALAVGLLAGPAAADGGSIYTAECARCHGADGLGDTPVGKAMKVPAIAGKTKDHVVATVRGNEKHKAVSAKLSDDDLAAVALKVASL
jgi:mono/diheme cytochrome c family protein